MEKITENVIIDHDEYFVHFGNLHFEAIIQAIWNPALEIFKKTLVFKSSKFAIGVQQ